MPGRRPPRADEVPEADAADQALSPDDDEPELERTAGAMPPVRELPREASEADVLDQALPAGETDDVWRDR
jgi:hypothetical protein